MNEKAYQITRSLQKENDKLKARIKELEALLNCRHDGSMKIGEISAKKPE